MQDNPWQEGEGERRPPADTEGMELPLDVGDTSVWSNAPSNYQPRYIHGQGNNPTAEFDPFATLPQSPPKEKETSKGIAPAGGLLGQPLLPTLSLSSITNVFRRVTPSTSPIPPSSPALQERKQENLEKQATNKRESGPSTPTRAVSPIKDRENDGDSFDYNDFMEDMHMRQADPIGKYVRSFMQNFAKRQLRTADQVQIVNNFLDFIAEKMRTNEIWRDATEKEFDNAIEGMEKLVMSRIYHLTFTPALSPELATRNPTDDLERDQVLTQRIRLFRWVSERHLDLPCDENQPDDPAPSSLSSDTANLPIRASGSKSAIRINSTKVSRRDGKCRQDYIEDATREMVKINQFRAPRDKLITILNCCIIIFNLIRANGEEGGADNFVPYLILVILKACPDHLVSNIQFIQRFRNPEKLQGEAGYYLQSLMGAIAFVETMDHSSLSNISQDEFEQFASFSVQTCTKYNSHMEQAICEMEPDLPQAPGLPPAQDSAMPLSPSSERNSQQDKDNVFGARDFIERSANLATSAVSKPLNAIGRIFTEIGTTSTTNRDELSSQLSPTDGSVRKRGYTGSAKPNSPPVSPTRPGFPTSASANSLKPGDFVADNLATSAIQAQIDQASAEQQAKMETLEQMFPQIEAETREVILMSFQNDLGAAVDALLEMGG